MNDKPRLDHTTRLGCRETSPVVYIGDRHAESLIRRLREKGLEPTRIQPGAAARQGAGKEANPVAFIRLPESTDLRELQRLLDDWRP